VVGADVALVDSAEATARATARVLAEEGIEGETPASRQYFVTDDARRFGHLAERFLGGPIEHLERVDLVDPGA